ncbi:terpene synthase family protein [Streptosporangium subroseum]|uniref:terpene synthase family protein n=1 Tax=Streptosporangium subroseum TaxID=106412 RepID=UPI003086CC20|nr:terpene synthase family protein [Streptosporangium subroseum]
MGTELRRPPCAATPPAQLAERLAAMAMPCPMHPSVYQIEAAVIDWSRGVGLDADPGAHRLAGRAFAGYDTGTASLFARWLTWMSRFREDPAAFAGVLAVAEGGEPGPLPLERSFANLWRACAPEMSQGWRERFLAGLTAQHEALLVAGTPIGDRPSAGDRLSAGDRKPTGSGSPIRDRPSTGEYPPFQGRPSIEDYPALGRNAFGRYLFDLVEPCAGVEVPAPVQESPRWRAVVEASGDVAAWCDDLITGRGYVAAASAWLDRPDDAAVEWVIDRVVARMEELWTAARAVPLLLERHDLGFAASREVTRVVCAFLTIPRAYLEWFLESSRYRHLG